MARKNVVAPITRQDKPLTVADVQIGDTLVADQNLGSIRKGQRVHVCAKRSWKIMLVERSPITGLCIELGDNGTRFFHKE